MRSGCLFFASACAFADWKQDVGYTQLQQELGSAAPVGFGVGVTQVEAFAGANYAAVAGTDGASVSGTDDFIGKTFHIKSGDTGMSGHAESVAQQIFGNGGLGPRSGIATGISNVDCYNADNWIGAGFLAPPMSAPLSESRAVENHAWIYHHVAGSESALTDILRRLDYAVNQSQFVCAAGMDNAFSSSDVPVLLVTAYNVLSVGLSNGGHSHGFTRAEYDGPGRIKPEIVAPLDYTSYSTAVVSGGAAVLREVAATTNAQRSETMRAVILAGATKDEFPGWAKTTLRPLDLIYGAGELNVYNSYKILSAPEQPPNSGAPVALSGWDHGSIAANGTADYVLEIPTDFRGVELSAMLVWNRVVTDTPGPGFVPTVSMPNMSLNFYKLPGTPGTLIESSNSLVDNLEHVWQKNLSAGQWRLRVGSNVAGVYSIAWRLSIVSAIPGVAWTVSPDGLTITFQFTGLEAGKAYTFQTSTDLVNWGTAHVFTAAAAAEQWVTAHPADPRRFYRLTWTQP